MNNKFVPLLSYQLRSDFRDYRNSIFIIVIPLLLVTYLVITAEEMMQDVTSMQYIVFVVVTSIIINFGGNLARYQEFNSFAKYKLLGVQPFTLGFSLFLNALIFQLLSIAIMMVYVVAIWGVEISYGSIHNILITLVLINLFQVAIAFFMTNIVNNQRNYNRLAKIISCYQIILLIFYVNFQIGPVSTMILEIINPVVNSYMTISVTWVEGLSIFEVLREIVIILALTAILLGLSSKYFKGKVGLRVLVLILSLAIITPGVSGYFQEPAIATKWEASSPEAEGFDPQKLEEFIQSLDHWGNVDSLVIIREGQVVEEYYRYPRLLDSYPMYSVTKPITGFLVGIAIDEGYIDSVDEKIGTYFPELEEKNPEMREITIENLLQMTSGVEWNEENVRYYVKNKEGEFRNDWTRAEVSGDPLGYYFSKSMDESPGEAYYYNSADSHVLSHIIEKATGMKPYEFADKYLFEPLDINMSYLSWIADDYGVNLGGSGIKMHTKDMAKIGDLALNDGSYNGKDVVPEEWIERTFQDGSEVSDDVKYGYHWYIYEDYPDIEYKFYGHTGSFGQGLFVVPELDLVLAYNSDSNLRRPVITELLETVEKE
ncbi:serine hydrolase domain-containing protein [Natranaerobius thermophilus]|uniref:Beta-lactamase n=1 Tax=Natranaerobius thermophilus (strain ATCC BAA-1301 / DSM 18059 / JW/NM-WN-LF) TaxID=457570 RepID=B2A0M1_NATTJ|nr:serine hydrolase [Natranaerobius thermophilus]ACB84597.1 beta-lactamase [Natranaerobius thermophilus JW/NM-WN-LF]